MFALFKKLFQKKKKTYVYAVVYHDFITGKHILTKHLSEEEFKEKMMLFNSYYAQIALIFIYEG